MIQSMTMAPTSAAAAVLFQVAVAALMAMAAPHQHLAAAAAAAGPPTNIGKPGCKTTCGNVSVPFPFGLSPGCYWPGLNLTCDTSHVNTPRLLLGDGTLRVTEISIENATVRVMRAGPIINATRNYRSDGWNVSFGRSFTDYGYKLSSSNELVVSGCNVVARILGDETPRVIAGCASFCSIWELDNGPIILSMTSTVTATSKYCARKSGCCQASVSISRAPKEVEAKWLYSGNHTMEQYLASPFVFVAEDGWVDKNGRLVANELEEVPIVLEWSVTQGLLQSDDHSCSDNVSRTLCKSEHSQCSSEKPGYTCRCNEGYHGNPYLLGGCQDIDECKLPSEENGCFGECINKMGSMECRCPHGTFGSPSVKGGCFKVKHSTTDPLLLPTVAPVQFVLHDYCNTSCGDVRVPYPFGIRPGCYRTGFNLTCNTSYNPPRLFLDSKGTLEVINISLLDSTVRVVHHTMTYTNATNLDEINTVIHFYIPDIGEPYALSIKNEFIFYGCNVQATLYGECNNDSISRIISSCNSTCRSSGNYLMYFYDRVVPLVDPAHHNGDYCHATIAAGSTPKRMDFKRLNLHTPIQKYFFMLAVAFLSEDGMTDQWHMTLNRMDLFNRPAADYMSSPLLLRWAVKKGFTASSASNSSGQCPREVANSLCRSQPSSCRQENGGFTCYCPKGYLGNPYITNGCIDIDECKITPKRCFGVCNNVPGKYKCRCKLGTFGNAKMPHGCVTLSVVLATFIKKNKIALSAASGPVLLLMGLGIILVPRKIEHHKMKLRKQKYFKQNRGQLLRQLVSQRADIAEKMIMTLDELAKATNNFDKDREIGGGGHGTVYKGILSDLHVVAIKKSKITVQKEIDEFINEVAILSQINHKNVVKLFGCCLETEVPLLVYEFISNGTLYHHLHIQGARSLSWDNRLRIATEIATSLAYLHSAVSIPIIHRDIKSTNVLLDDTLTAKVSDFGASRYIPIEKTGLTTRVQGTIGYLDPMYFQTNRLTEKSDVYSFGVILVELLTRKKPFSYLSPEGDGLVSHFLDLHVKAELFQIIDPQVIEEGGEEVQEVAALAASCINLLRGDERPTMRQVEHTLEGVRVSKMWKNHGMVAADLENDRVVFSCPSSTNNGQGFEESSRRYSLEQEMMMSVRYPR